MDDSENFARNAVATRSVGATTSGLNSVNVHFEKMVAVHSAREGEEPIIEEDRLALAIEEETFLAAPRIIQTVAETTVGLNMVANLSTRELTDNEVSLLSKGLNICPTPRD